MPSAGQTGSPRRTPASIRWALIARVVGQRRNRRQVRFAAELGCVPGASGEQIVQDLARRAAAVALGVDEVRAHAVARREEAVLVEHLGMRLERGRDVALGRLQPYRALHERGQRGVVPGACLGVQDAPIAKRPFEWAVRDQRDVA